MDIIFRNAGWLCDAWVVGWVGGMPVSTPKELRKEVAREKIYDTQVSQYELKQNVLFPNQTICIILNFKYKFKYNHEPVLFLVWF